MKSFKKILWQWSSSSFPRSTRVHLLREKQIKRDHTEIFLLLGCVLSKLLCWVLVCASYHSCEGSSLTWVQLSRARGCLSTPLLHHSCREGFHRLWKSLLRDSSLLSPLSLLCSIAWRKLCLSEATLSATPHPPRRRVINDALSLSSANNWSVLASTRNLPCPPLVEVSLEGICVN
jgi:hypothetical protein